MDATAEATGLEPGSVNAVVAAQAFHWFEPLRFRAECARMLKPGGVVALLWNVRRADASPFSAGYEALLRARRRKARGWDAETKELYQRHQWRVEGKHGEAKTTHGLRRAVRRGRWNVAIQAYLTAAVMNLKCLAAILHMLFSLLYRSRPTSDQPIPASSI